MLTNTSLNSVYGPVQLLSCYHVTCIQQRMSQTCHTALGNVCPGNEPKARIYYLGPYGLAATWRSFSIQLEALCECLFCSLDSKSHLKR